MPHWRRNHDVFRRIRCTRRRRIVRLLHRELTGLRPNPFNGQTLHRDVPAQDPPLRIDSESHVAAGHRNQHRIRTLPLDRDRERLAARHHEPRILGRVGGRAPKALEYQLEERERRVDQRERPGPGGEPLLLLLLARRQVRNDRVALEGEHGSLAGGRVRRIGGTPRPVGQRPDRTIRTQDGRQPEANAHCLDQHIRVHALCGPGELLDGNRVGTAPKHEGIALGRDRRRRYHEQQSTAEKTCRHGPILRMT